MCLILILKLWTKTLFTCSPVHLRLVRDRTFVTAYGRETRARLWASGRDPVTQHPLHKPETRKLQSLACHPDGLPKPLLKLSVESPQAPPLNNSMSFAQKRQTLLGGLACKSPELGQRPAGSSDSKFLVLPHLRALGYSIGKRWKGRILTQDRIEAV